MSRQILLRVMLAVAVLVSAGLPSSGIVPTAGASSLQSGDAVPSQQAETPGRGGPDRPPPQYVGEKRSALAAADREAVVTSADGKVSVRVPAGAVAEDVEVSYRQRKLPANVGFRFRYLFDIEAEAIDRGRAPVTTFDKDVEITINFTPEDLRGIDYRSFKLMSLDEETGAWEPLPTVVDFENFTMRATTTHFSQFGAGANPAYSLPGIATGFNVNLQTGAASYRYPLKLPPGPGGFQPSLQLAYSGRGVDEMKNKRDVGSWVGIGWTLHFGRISYSEETTKYQLELGGGSHEIVYDSTALVYRTKPEAFFDIDRVGTETWIIRDRAGNKYQFGGFDTTCVQSRYDGTTTVFYRWDLCKTTDGPRQPDERDIPPGHPVRWHR